MSEPQRRAYVEPPAVPAHEDASAVIFRFRARVEPAQGAMYYNHVIFPWSVPSVFGTKGRVRMKGTMQGIPFQRALNPSKSGHFLLISHRDLKTAGVGVGDEVSIEAQVDTSPLQFAIPEEVEAALNLEPEARAAFDALALGKRRNLCHWVASAKRPETRAQRAAELLSALLDGTVAAKRSRPDRGAGARAMK